MAIIIFVSSDPIQHIKYIVYLSSFNQNSKYNPKLDMTTHALTLVGESYAGTYIPSVARGIYLNKKALLPNYDGTPPFIVLLFGIAIGNGKIDNYFI